MKKKRKKLLLDPSVFRNACVKCIDMNDQCVGTATEIGREVLLRIRRIIKRRPRTPRQGWDEVGGDVELLKDGGTAQHSTAQHNRAQHRKIQRTR
jgi:hypothetical protein